MKRSFIVPQICVACAIWIAIIAVFLQPHQALASWHTNCFSPSKVKLMRKSISADYKTHEVLHMSSFLMQSVDRELLEHDAIKNNREWRLLAETAHEALHELYQAIGAAHLSEESD